jgi:pimeloyl-ACP methyl ester carboxylesterase
LPQHRHVRVRWQCSPKTRQVIGVDLQGHGRTPLGDREISLVDMSDDMTLLLKELGYGQVDAAPARGGTDSSMLTGR